ncbi:MAG: tRNA (adenosine(37)-N6)-threonylcarbamoyltransferase complex ATPase subunit type 1 TsaE [Verrucomicrobiales bacterium]|nr:tRNA (adenosine(37)-N6)-threonylcarbamoyltransferase complex ATPase subunit type 1 TsaE [Verrucomicrobiales bacterium]
MSDCLSISDEAGMIAAGADLGASLEAGSVVALCGDLGAGKTHFSKGIVSGIGADDAVSSPTFSLVNEYRSGRLPVFHFDFYRLESADELIQIGWDDYLDEEGVVIVEWADKFPGLLPEEVIRYDFTVGEDQVRTLRKR